MESPASGDLTPEMDDAAAERVARELSPEAKRILLAVVDHSVATSPDGVAEHGHNGFITHFDGSVAPYIECGICHAHIEL